MKEKKLGLIDIVDYQKIHATLNDLDELDNFCKEHQFGYGLFKDGSVYVSENNRNNDRGDVWWGRIFENGNIEVYMYLNELQLIRPQFENILKNLVANNKDYFRVNKEGDK